MPACLFQFFIFKKKPWIEGWHNNYLVSESVPAKVIKIIKAAPQLKKRPAGVKENLGRLGAHSANNLGADNFNLPEEKRQTGFYFIFSGSGVGPGKTFHQSRNINFIP